MEEELLLFNKQWDEAMLSNQVDKIAAFMSDDWVIVGTGGGITSRESFLETIRSGEVSHNRMDSDEIRVKIYGDTGVVTSRGTSAGKYKGQPFHLYEWATSVFVRKEGTWRCVITMLTPALSEQ